MGIDWTCLFKSDSSLEANKNSLTKSLNGFDSKRQNWKIFKQTHMITKQAVIFDCQFFAVINIFTC